MCSVPIAHIASWLGRKRETLHMWKCVSLGRLSQGDRGASGALRQGRLKLCICGSAYPWVVCREEIGGPATESVA